MLDSDGEGTEALRSLAVEPHGRFGEGVSFRALARLERLDARRVEHINVSGDSGIK